ncbi:MAG TPA: hypothetical protein PK624_12280 [Spirochaetota bacterium]|nr:hypothetical protein [Spirochaetota bacterium]HOR45560.1 hypothetical protein [Spirochaetota bacterium]HPK57143.1 hypothetical protein [Spirochaetota bacterium]
MNKLISLTSILFICAVVLNSASCKNTQAGNPNGKPVQFRLVKDKINSENYSQEDQLIESLEDAVLLCEKDIAEVFSKTDYMGRPAMMINLTPDGARIFADITANNIGRNLAIVFEGKIILSARIMTQINSGDIMVSGSFSQKEIDDMVKNISGN